MADVIVLSGYNAAPRNGVKRARSTTNVPAALSDKTLKAAAKVCAKKSSAKPGSFTTCMRKQIKKK